VEGFLERALDEIEQLRIQVQPLPIIVEDSLDDNDFTYSPRKRDRHRVGVSAGRSLLRHHAMDNDEVSFASTQDGSTGSTTTDASYYISLTRRSAEKRHRLINRLKMVTDDVSPTAVVVFSSGDREGLDLNYANALSRNMKNIAKVIRRSGKSLGLGGRWFSTRPSRPNRKKDDEDVDMETMANSYCKSVESLISKQKDEVKELKAFCDYLEEKVADM
jgi:hypothetical protein